MDDWKKRIKNKRKDEWGKYDELGAESLRLKAKLNQLRQEEPLNGEAIDDLQLKIIERLEEIRDEFNKQILIREASLKLVAHDNLKRMKNWTEKSIIEITGLLKESIEELDHISDTTTKDLIINRIGNK
ncbi:MAG: hypothetical protein P8Y23_04375 [Candidatus Lokiarchaeota archaeon]|jgi:hypothetical protein